MIEWIPTPGSARVTAVAYLKDAETILVEFPNGIKWWYSECPPLIWEEFNAPGTSKGHYIAEVLNHHPNGRYEG